MVGDEGKARSDGKRLIQYHCVFRKRNRKKLRQKEDMGGSWPSTNERERLQNE